VKASNTLNNKKTENGNLKSSIQKKYLQLDKEKDNNKSAKGKLIEISNEKFTLEQKIEEVIKIIIQKIYDIKSFIRQ